VVELCLLPVDRRVTVDAFPTEAPLVFVVIFMAVEAGQRGLPIPGVGFVAVGTVGVEMPAQ
jgi:hypothetical protein